MNLLNDAIETEETQASGKSSFVIDRRILLLSLRKRIKYIVVFMIAAMILSAVWAKFSISPSWKANCFVIRAPKNMSTPVEMPYLYQSFDINTILETVRTRDVLSDVIEKLRLKATPEGLHRAIDVQRGNRSNVMKFSVTWPDRDLAAKIANATAESFIENNTKLLNSATLKIFNYYTDQREMRLENIQTLELKSAEFRAQHGIISIPNETQTKFDLLKEIEIKMIENNLRYTEMDSKISEMNSKLKDVPEEVITNWTYSQTDEKKLLQLQKELELLKAKYTEENPKVKKILKEIEELKKIAKTSARDLPDAVTWGPSGLTDTYTIEKTRYEAEKQASKNMDAEYLQKAKLVKESLENLTQVQKDYAEIERQLSLNHDVLRIVESRLAEAKMAMQSNVSDYEILEPAKAPNYPEGTNKKGIVVAAGMLAFLLGCLIVVGKDLTTPLLKSDKDLSTLAQIPLIGIIPDEGHVTDNVFYRNFQVMVDNIIRKTADNKKPVICIGSDIQEAGKSFLLNDIISMLSGQGKRILYIDSLPVGSPETEPFLINNWVYNNSDTYKLDTGNPNVHRAYFLADDNTFRSVIERSRLSSLFDSLENYDYIFWELIDSHYNIQLFSSIATASDILIMIGRFNRSNRFTISKTVKFLKDRNFNNTYGVLNYVHKDYFQETF